VNDLTNRIVTVLLLSDKPMSSVDVWDALADSTLTRAVVVGELRALWSEGRVALHGEGRASTYSLATQAVAS